ncbi:hypothetical protein ACFFK7_08090 [Pseudoalteromonas xiamenensis]|uniref:hypothetical protein n=1 Tax=Pseudoalteromonas xiamenensis TaxID=882626 RepID=UPI0035EA5003
MRVLYISSSLPPNHDSQTIRNGHFISALTRGGVTVDTLSVDSESFSEKNFYGTSKNYSSEAPLLLRVINLVRSKLGKYIVSNILHFIVAPDLYVGWRKKALKVFVDNDFEYDLIVSASGSYIAHVIAFNMSVKYSVPFVCDFGDPWAYNPIWPENMWHKKLINKYYESKVLNATSSVVFTNESTCNFYKSKYNGINSVVIPMGYNKRLEAKEWELSPAKLDVIKFSHIGVAYRKSRNLLPLINALGRHEGIALNIIGPHSTEFSKVAKACDYKNVYFLGKVSYEESEKLLDLADVNVVVGNTGGLQIPGKLYSVIGIAKPLFYISQENSDPAIALLSKLPGCIVVKNDCASLQEAAFRVRDNYPEYLSEARERTKLPLVEALSWECIGTSFLKHIKSITQDF